MIDQLRGTGVALASPMNIDLTIDFEGLSKLIDHVIKGGVDYLVLLGTTGESPTISWEEKLQMLDFCINKLQGSIPLIFGLGGNSTSDILTNLKALNGRNFSSILSASPYYNKPSQEGIFQHYTAIADNSEFPIIIYNVPHRTGSNVTAETTLRLSRHENICGIKEASDDRNQFEKIMQDKPSDFCLLSGDDALTFSMLSHGAEGVISVVANAYPKEFCKMVRTTLEGDFEKGAKMNENLNELFELSGAEGNPTSIKAALSSLNICNSTVRMPLLPASPELIGEFEKIKF